ncbi:MULTISPECIES: competence type IV pilus ATPase ComGA [Solibacillus]|uniref:Flp pilus assembly complex ATPase component TadA n=1 Tax=Solibacillus merdavium TaxID=2762218 RepID=A0ABR8XRF7_9BACL|nr:competence type IV pilus ATPase ComGA [Solibacillus merdavium]MBD8034533.1 Flp pilus assembly complex ATPase component TadA [Solibacillus merdavium]
MITIEQQSIIEQKCLELLSSAAKLDATDIHLNPREECFDVLLRKYGRFEKATEIPNELAIRMISYFKFLSSLDISEKRKPQSGAFQKFIGQSMYAFRISTLPSSFYKESLAIRLLRQNHTVPLKTLCHFHESVRHLDRLARLDSGLILISGATGSGKTTTLYSLLQYCAQHLSRHVISIEDPVESTQDYLLQVQVNERAGITYSAGLKAVLRHSPEVIMLGEIRDQETAKVAMEAAFSGHLVISTIHAKDTVNCLYRLQDLSISYEEMRQMLKAVISQRLVETNEQGYKAVFEFLTEEQLQRAIESILEGNRFSLPYHQTIAGQKALLKGEDYEFTSQ